MRQDIIPHAEKPNQVIIDNHPDSRFGSQARRLFSFTLTRLVSLWAEVVARLVPGGDKNIGEEIFAPPLAAIMRYT